jgi:hypothetical protein
VAIRPRIIFDTTAINRLEDGGNESEPLMRALEIGYDVRLTAMSADEIVANAKNPERRRALLRRFGWLLHNARCIWPPNELVRLLVTAHQSNPTQFDWRQVYVRALVYENAIPRQEFDDELCIEQRRVQFELERQFEKAWKALRPKLDAIITRDPSQLVPTFEEAARVCINPGGVLWGFGKGLYEHATGGTITDDEVKAFIGICPPFRAACYAMVMAWFNWSLSPPSSEKVPRSGRNDLMMAAYLPYCSKFVTADYAQHKDLTEIAKAAQIDCDIILFDQFSQSFNPISLSAEPRL